MSTVIFKRGDMATMNATPKTDGMVFFNEENNRIYMDNGNTRYQYGGDTELISNVNIATVSNAFNAQTSLDLFLQKTTVVDAKSNALAVNQNYIPLGCLAFKEAIGTADYSGIGNGTVSGGLVQFDNQLTANNNKIYMDYKDGKYGINTSSNRGADTFIPFKQKAVKIGSYNGVTSVNVSNVLANYQNYSREDFILVVTGIYGSNKRDYPKPMTAHCYPNISSYNNMSGVLTLSGMSGVSSDQDGYADCGVVSFDIYINP